MKKNLLVTIADKNYINQAKQLFSSVYFNSGWKGDYMLLFYDMPEDELKWFKDKGILVKKYKPFLNGKIGKFGPILLLKFCLFTTYFKKWNNIIYLDSDIIVRASLEELTKIKGFYAVRHFPEKLSYQFINRNNKTYNLLRNNYDLNEKSFNAGMMAFSTDIIDKNTFIKLEELVRFYREITFLGDQPAFNLYFYRKWKELPISYNFNPYVMSQIIPFKNNNTKGAVVFHFYGRKINRPWHHRNIFYKEWKNNLNRANKINLDNVLEPLEINHDDIKSFSMKMEKYKKKLFIRLILLKISVFINIRILKKYKYSKIRQSFY